MFNLSGSEIVVILLLALVVLGPEKLPDAMRRAGRAYAELKKLSSGFQSEVRSAFEEPVQEMRETADMLRKAATFDAGDAGGSTKPTRLLTDADSAPPPDPDSDLDDMDDEDDDDENLDDVDDGDLDDLVGIDEELDDELDDIDEELDVEPSDEVVEELDVEPSDEVVEELDVERRDHPDG